MTDPQLTRLQEHLAKLKLVTIQARLETLLQDAGAQEVTSADFLDRLLAEEVAAKREKDGTMRTVMARFPDRKTLESVDCSFQPSLDRQQVQELATGRVIEHGDNVVFLGPPGTGNTPLAIGLGWKAVQQD
jgi:DNA replication protein DnaC